MLGEALFDIIGDGRLYPIYALVFNNNIFSLCFLFISYSLSASELIFKFYIILEIYIDNIKNFIRYTIFLVSF